MSIEELNNQLNTLRRKWMGRVPKDSADPNWWRFKCDKCLALRIKSQIEHFEEKPIEKNTSEVAQMIFGK